ncbi:MAG: hypothetical protein V6Z89_08670, partial [Desulfobacter sp.]
IFIGVKTIPERHYHRHPSLGIFCWSPEKDGYARGNVKLSGKILTFSCRRYFVYSKDMVRNQKDPESDDSGSVEMRKDLFC